MTRTYNAFAHIKPQYSPSARVNHVGSYYLDDAKEVITLLTHKRSHMGMFEYTAHPILGANVEPYQTIITNLDGFDNVFTRWSDMWHDILIDADVPYTMIASMLRDGVPHILAVACLNLLMEDRKEVSAEDLQAAFATLCEAVNNFGKPSPLEFPEVISYANTVLHYMANEIDDRNHSAEDDDDAIPFDGKPLVSRDIGGNVYAVGSSADMTRPIVSQWQEAGYDSFVDFIAGEFPDQDRRW